MGIAIEDLSPRHQAEARKQMAEPIKRGLCHPASRNHMLRHRFPDLYKEKQETHTPLPVSAEPLRLWFPNLILPSLNMMLGSGKKKHQAAAKSDALAAVLDLSARGKELWRFEVPVSVLFAQIHLSDETAKKDVANLHVKHLLDLFTAKHKNGLGIIADDGPEFVKHVSLSHGFGAERGVAALIAPARKEESEWPR